MASVQILGAGVAGFALARELVQAGYDGQIVLNDPQGLPYDRPPLSKSLERVPFAPPQWFAQHSIELRDELIETPPLPTSKEDWLVLATGTTPLALNVPGAENAKVIHTASVAEELAQKLSFGAFGTHAVVIGAGLIGAEFAAAARQFGATVTLISNQELPAQKAFGPALARQLHEDHRIGGIRLITGQVQNITEHTVRVNDEELEADIIVSAIGVTPNVQVAQQLGVRTDDGILVDQHQRTNLPQVLAVGDVTRHPGERAYRHWEHAIEDAQIAASTIMATPTVQRQTPWFWSDRHESHIEVVGDFSRAKYSVERLNWQERIQISFGLNDQGQLVAAALADPGQDSDIMRELIAHGRSPNHSDLQNPRISLRDLGQS
ncbi:NAD(P)/FAD-dependent oxidoreductase [Glutamicibacter uratoxydans]|uniref:NAD(P)/FAD-dependent oxidoreductase n=1 Tax=Glutamicibacter uratoxydans TaxID=43667 RepID=UPI003D6EC07B